MGHAFNFTFIRLYNLRRTFLKNRSCIYTALLYLAYKDTITLCRQLKSSARMGIRPGWPFAEQSVSLSALAVNRDSLLVGVWDISFPQQGQGSWSLAFQ